MTRILIVSKIRKLYSTFTFIADPGQQLIVKMGGIMIEKDVKKVNAINLKKYSFAKFKSHLL